MAHGIGLLDEVERGRSYRRLGLHLLLSLILHLPQRDGMHQLGHGVVEVRIGVELVRPGSYWINVLQVLMNNMAISLSCSCIRETMYISTLPWSSISKPFFLS
jgi:hypothetical protein